MTTFITLAIGILLGALACYLILSNHLRNKYDERNPEQTDEQLKLMYKTYYNETFKKITGRSWLDSDN